MAKVGDPVPDNFEEVEGKPLFTIMKDDGSLQPDYDNVFVKGKLPRSSQEFHYSDQFQNNGIELYTSLTPFPYFQPKTLLRLKLKKLAVPETDAPAGHASVFTFFPPDDPTVLNLTVMLGISFALPGYHVWRIDRLLGVLDIDIRDEFGVVSEYFIPIPPLANLAHGTIGPGGVFLGVPAHIFDSVTLPATPPGDRILASVAAVYVIVMNP